MCEEEKFVGKIIFSNNFETKNEENNQNNLVIEGASTAITPPSNNQNNQTNKPQEENNQPQDNLIIQGISEEGQKNIFHNTNLSEEKINTIIKARRIYKELMKLINRRKTIKSFSQLTNWLNRLDESIRDIKYLNLDKSGILTHCLEEIKIEFIKIAKKKQRKISKEKSKKR